MKIVTLDNKFLDSSTGLAVKGKPVGVALAHFLINQKEIADMKATAEKVWDRVNSGKFRGLIRFDLIPRVSSPVRKAWGFDVGEIQIGGIYEVNAHSPECLAASAAMYELAPYLYHGNEYAKRTAKKLREISEEILVVIGNGSVKEEWSGPMTRILERFGLKITLVSEEEAARASSVVWRWGDARGNGGATEFPEWFRLKMLQMKNVFNTVLDDEKDPSAKTRLIPQDKEDREWESLTGRNKILSLDSVEWGLKNKNNLVLKPLRGASGNGILFGRMLDPQKWEKLLLSLAGKEYGLFEARWLPRVPLFEMGEFAFDLNPAFWAEDGKLTYLYTIIRLDEWRSYWEKGVINVAQGAAFAGVAVEE